MRFRKKPIVVEAFRWTIDEVPDWWRYQNDLVMTNVRDKTVLIPTLEGKMLARPGDWIVKGVEGELYPVKPSVFEDTYEPVENV